MILVLMGVSGSGKTTVGRMLARELGWPFYDGDGFHPPANIARMRAGLPLTDEHRRTWLHVLAVLIRRLEAEGTPAVVACSALRASYRASLRDASPAVRFVYLRGPYALIRERLAAREDHFFDPDLLDSQYAALEEPAGVPAISVEQALEVVIGAIRAELGI